MKILKTLVFYLLSFTSVIAQSIILDPYGQSINGDIEGVYQLDVNSGGFLVKPKYDEDNDQEDFSSYSMSCSAEFFTTTENGILSDPSGAASYTPSVVYDCSYKIESTVSDFVGFRIKFDLLDIDALGDYMTIEDYNTGEVLYRLSGSILPSDELIIPNKELRIRFKTDGDSQVGSGFNFQWTTIKENPKAHTEGYLGGNVLKFDLYDGSFLGGNSTKNMSDSLGQYAFSFGDGNRAFGIRSVAIGLKNKSFSDNSVSIGAFNVADSTNTTAIGYTSQALGKFSTAIGFNSKSSAYGSMALGCQSTSSGAYSFASTFGTASGNSSFAHGNNSEASNTGSMAMGFASKAEGYRATAIGNYVSARDSFSVALGYNSYASGKYALGFCNTCHASGPYSSVLGNSMSTNNKEGTFMIGDSPNGATPHYANVSNRMITRFRNGYYFYTNAANTIGVKLLAGDNSWSTASDSTLKENFIPSNSEEVLDAVAQMRVGTWNYKTQDPSKYRHWGVMAQDFYHHFGKDKYGTIGSDTLIASADFDGVAFAAIKALEERTRELFEELNTERIWRKALQNELKELNDKQVATLSLIYDRLEMKEEFVTKK